MRPCLALLCRTGAGGWLRANWWRHSFKSHTSHRYSWVNNTHTKLYSICRRALHTTWRLLLATCWYIEQNQDLHVVALCFTLGTQRIEVGVGIKWSRWTINFISTRFCRTRAEFVGWWGQSTYSINSYCNEKQNLNTCVYNGR